MGLKNLSDFYGRWDMSDEEECLILKDVDKMWGEWNENLRCHALELRGETDG